jgi:hypothetical protein
MKTCKRSVSKSYFGKKGISHIIKIRKITSGTVFQVETNSGKEETGSSLIRPDAIGHYLTGPHGPRD